MIVEQSTLTAGEKKGRCEMVKTKITFTSDDMDTMFHLLRKLEDHCADRNMSAREAEITNMIRKLNDMGFKQTSK